MQVAVSITYFHITSSVDVDNIIKPILDGLWPEIMEDDRQVRDVSASRRDLNEELRLVDPPPALLESLGAKDPFVYIALGSPISEEDILWIGI
jgi:hypothetical protein